MEKYIDKVALLIIDVQNDYFEGGSNPLHNPIDALCNIESILKKFRNNGLPVIHVQHINKKLRTFFKPNTWGAEIHEKLTPLENETIIVKHKPNSFEDTELEEVLKEKGINKLVICGMQTSLCVSATTPEGHTRGFEITLLEDACAAPCSGAHDDAIKNLRKYANVIKAGEYVI